MMIEKDISIASIQIHCIGRQLFLRRNVKNLHLCPVISLLTWLSILRYQLYYCDGDIL